MIQIRPAGTHDVEGLMALRSEAEQWLRAAGTDQWSDPDTGGQAIIRWQQSINEGRTWVVLDRDQALIGTVSRGPADRDFWTDADSPETGLYLYKLIISRSAQRGLGGMVVDWLSRVAALEGRDWLRIDCWRTNRRLHEYYEGLGFTHVRTEAPAHRKSGWLAQRPAGVILTGTDSLLIGSARRRDQVADPR
jgi:GNAT superfamily N-acetyltransferase